MSYLRPSFFIIGERKCGTSSLYRYLIAHPNVLPCQLKEPNFFGKGKPYVQQNIDEYWAMFPQKNTAESIKFDWPELNERGILYHEKVEINRLTDVSYITGEASVNTFFEVNPTLVHQYLPDVQLILLFRNPVERAFSHHRMNQRFQEEGRSLGFRVHTFEEDIERELALFYAGEPTIYLSPGVYLNQLKKWRAVYPSSKFRIYFTETLKESKGAITILKDLQQFLGLPHFDYQKEVEEQYNVAPRTEMSTKIRQKLRGFYRKYNLALAAYLNIELPREWE
ncbi:MAG: sulfotransferase [Bacteroidota bacterium]